jgi:hypothetical protein
MPILVRPHPARTREWEEVDLSAEQDIAVWGRNPVDAEAKDGYFDSLHHSAAVVGLNTSAFIEAAIVGRPVFAPLLPELHENQEGTIHFHYLTTVGGGLLHTARTLETHFTQINEALVAGSHESPRSRRFVDAFVRPHGRQVAATPVFVDAVEQIRRTAAAHSRRPLIDRLLATALRPLAVMAAHPAAGALVLSEHERDIAARDRAHRAQVDAAWRAKDAVKADEQRRKEQRLMDRQRHKAARAAEWRRTKRINSLKQRIRKRIGLPS